MLDHWYSIDWIVQQTAEPVWQWSWWAVGSRYNTVKSLRYFIRTFCNFSPRWPWIQPKMEQTCYFTPRWPRISPQMEKKLCYFSPRWPWIQPQMEQTCYFTPRWPRIPPHMEQTCYFTPRWPWIPPQTGQAVFHTPVTIFRVISSLYTNCSLLWDLFFEYESLNIYMIFLQEYFTLWYLASAQGYAADKKVKFLKLV